MKNKFIRFLVDILLLGVASIVVGYLVGSFIGEGTIVWDLSYAFTTYTGIAALVIYGAYVVIKLNKLDSKDAFSSSSSGGKKKKGKKQDEEQYFQGGWLTMGEMKKRFVNCRYSELRNLDLNKRIGYYGAGVAIRAELIGPENRGKDIDVTLVEPVHTLVVGNTRSGKGESFVKPNIQILSELETKPSFVITDPKGELYDTNAAKLRKRGYDVKVFDLRQPFKSDMWNPLSCVYDMYQEMLNIKKDVYIHRNETPQQCGLKFDKNATYGDSWFEFRGEAYSTELEMETAVEGQKQTLLGEISSTVTDIANIMIPLDDPKQASWVHGGRDFMKAILLSMLEDSADPSLGMTREKYNMYNFYRIANIKSDDEDDRFSILREYFDGRSPIFGIKELGNAVTTSGQQTAASYLSVVTPALGLFADPAICFVTSQTEIDFSTFSTKPTALFIKVPDETPVYHKIAGMMIEQLYKELTNQANDQGGALKRPVIYMLDEFANLPKFEKMGGYISVGAGRHIFFNIIVQDYSQLAAKYGDQEAKTIKNNCNLKIFVGSNEMQTLKEFQELLGSKVVQVTTENKSKSDGKDGGKSTSTQTTDQKRDLMFVEELQTLPEDNLVCVLTKCKPIKTIATRTYKCTNIYDMKKAPEDFKPTRYLNTEAVNYDINGYIEKKESQNPRKRRDDWF